MVDISKKKEQRLKEAQKVMDQARSKVAIGKFEDAEKLFRYCAQIRSGVLEGNDPGMSAVALELGDMWMAQHQFARAEPFYLDAYKTVQEGLSSDPNKPLRAQHRHLLREIAFLYYLQGTVQATRSEIQQQKWMQAEKAFKRAIQLTEADLGKLSPELVEPLRNLASLYVKTGDFHNSEINFRRCIGIQLITKGLDDAGLLITRQQLAIVHERKDQQKFHDAALTIQTGWKMLGAKILRNKLKSERAERMKTSPESSEQSVGYFTPGAEGLGDWDPDDESTTADPSSIHYALPPMRDAVTSSPGSFTMVISAMSSVPKSVQSVPSYPHWSSTAPNEEFTKEEIELLSCFPLATPP